jgi:hypothetical protein
LPKPMPSELDSFAYPKALKSKTAMKKNSLLAKCLMYLIKGESRQFMQTLMNI